MLNNWTFIENTPGGGLYFRHKKLNRAMTLYDGKIIFWRFKDDATYPVHSTSNYSQDMDRNIFFKIRNQILYG